VTLATVLVANRGEIAVRIIATCRRLGLATVAVYSDADAGAPHVTAAETAVHLGPTPARDSYLSVPAIIAAADAAGADAVHPGYGFLSESPQLARACADAGLVFIGPPPEATETMGDKVAAKTAVEAAGVAVVPGVHRPGLTDAELTAAADEIGYPVLVKAAAGGGGKGMRVVEEPAELAEALGTARREASGAFGDEALLLERYLPAPRHIEVQVVAEADGEVFHLGERECSLQRRHQKIIEEAPSPAVGAELRRRMGASAVEVARACGYRGAGTVEFIVPGDPAVGQPAGPAEDDSPSAGADLPEFFFLEMNTRLQVEHPVTEAVYGVDLVEAQLRIAAGQPSGLAEREPGPSGHAIEARLYAEDPDRGFLPTAGQVLAYREPSGPGVRVDSGLAAGVTVGTDYDPMLAKLIAHADDRATALARLDGALSGLTVLGVTTNNDFLRQLLAHRAVAAGATETGLAERFAAERQPAAVPAHVLAAAALARLAALEPDGPVVDPFALPSGWRMGEHAWTTWRLRPASGEAAASGEAGATDVAVTGRAHDARVAVGDTEPCTAGVWWARSPPGEPATLMAAVDGRTEAYAYAFGDGVAWLGRHGRVWALAESDPLATRGGPGAAEAGPLTAPLPGTVAAVRVKEGDPVVAGQVLVVVEAMKMEHPIAAPVEGVVTWLAVTEGQAVAINEAIGAVEADE
jgi:acetyl-CoA/propionyl-CoA carboxylase biotin carboxyl carrier protein